MKETTPSAMPPCFEKWCRRFDDVFSNLRQKLVILLLMLPLKRQPVNG